MKRDRLFIRGIGAVLMAAFVPSLLLGQGGEVPWFQPRELILIPVPVGVTPGRFGSFWLTELWVHNRGSVAVSFVPSLCNLRNREGCFVSLLPGQTMDVKPLIEQGELFNALELLGRHGNSLHVNLRMRELTHSAESLGVEIPVIREHESLSGRAAFLNFGFDPNSRVALRLFLLPGSPNREVFVIRLVSEAGSTIRQSEIAMESGVLPAIYTGAYVPSRTVSELFTDIHAPRGSLRLEIEPRSEATKFWAFLSITNNQTQQVTIVTPQ